MPEWCSGRITAEHEARLDAWGRGGYYRKRSTSRSTWTGRSAKALIYRMNGERYHLPDETYLAGILRGYRQLRPEPADGGRGSWKRPAST